MADRELIRNVPLFASLPAFEIDVMAATLPSAVYADGTTLFHEGEPGDRLYVVLSGEVEIVKALGEREERLLSVTGPGELIGEMSLLTPGELRSASARVRGQAQVMEMNAQDFEKLIARHPALMLKLLRIMSDRLRRSDEAVIRDLESKNRQLSAAYAELQAAQERLVEQEALARELSHAQQIQERMLPDSLPAAPGIDIGARMIPARMVGGDFYDVFLSGTQINPQTDPQPGTPLEKLSLIVGDVAGKSIPAALFMALSASLLRAELPRAAHPGDAMYAVNQHLMNRNMPSMFVTVLYGELSLPSRTLTYVRAGHEHPLIWDRNGEAIAAEQGRAHPLGLFPQPVLETQTIALPPGSTLLFYTDGVTEAMNAEAEPFGRERLRATAASKPNLSAQELCDHIVETVTTYQHSAVPADDMTLLVVRVQ